MNYQVGQRLANQRYAGRFTLPERPYAELPLAFAVAKGRNAPLLAAFDAGLAAAIADGTHARIVRSWTGG